MTGTTLSLDLQGRLSSILDSIQQSAHQAGQFAAQQAPDLVRQVIAWQIAKDSILLAACLLASIVAIVVGQEFWSIATKKGEYESDGWFICSFVAHAVFFFLCFLFLEKALDLLQVLIAPKLFLLEYAASLLHP